MKFVRCQSEGTVAPGICASVTLRLVLGGVQQLEGATLTVIHSTDQKEVKMEGQPPSVSLQSRTEQLLRLKLLVKLQQVSSHWVYCKSNTETSR